LEVNSDDVCAEGFHFFEVFNDSGPFFVPVVFDEPAGVIVVVIEAPGDELSARLSVDEVCTVIANSDELKAGCPKSCLGCMYMATKTKQEGGYYRKDYCTGKEMKFYCC
jgi:hypothetical protein